jgi:FlaA1/EpsC-like NDP-sugar epimerase
MGKAMHLRSFLFSLRNRHFLAVDLVIFGISPTVAMLLRLESLSEFSHYASSVILYTWIFLFIKPFLLWGTRLYSIFWPYASVDALKTLALSAIVALVVEVALFFGVLYPSEVLPSMLPRTLPVINAVLTMVLVGSVRLAVRMLFEVSDRKQGGIPMKPVLIAGAGVAGALIVKELRMNPQVGLQPVAFLDDDTRLHGRRIHGVMVVGRLASLREVARRHRTQQVIIAMPTAPGKVVRDLVQACHAAGVTSRTVPGLFEIASGQARVSELREIQIEDLLRRGVIQTDPSEVRQLLEGKRVMVTGAGGSIGSELCRQIALSEPAQLVLLGHGENSIFKIANELKKRLPALKAPAVIADIRDRKRMQMVLRAYQPEVIFHAAAHKHVGLMQANVSEAVTNNVLGTRNLVELAAQYGAERFVMISSDKAVNPTSVMGVTKRIAELIVRDAAVTVGKPFVSVRFGNVLGSRGSVVPIFKAQIAVGGPVTVSDPKATRFFMTIPEAVQLVLQAGAMGTGGEVFVLDMGEPVRVLDLARDVIRLSGLTEGRDIDIVFTGLKPGEKLHEELFLANESPEQSRHPKILVCAKTGQTRLEPLFAGAGVEAPVGPVGREGDVVLRQSVQELIEAVQLRSMEPVLELIKRIVPEYQPTVATFPTFSSESQEKKGAVRADQRVISPSGDPVKSLT